MSPVPYFLSFALALFGGSLKADQEMIQTDNQSITVGDYSVQNNVWPDAVRNLKAGADYVSTITFDRSSIQSSMVANWRYPNVEPPNWIYGYPTLTWGVGENGVWNKANSQKISNLTSFTADYAVSISGEKNNFNVAFDLYLYSKPVGMEGWKKSAEIMVKVHAPWPEGDGLPYSDGVIAASKVVKYDIVGAMTPTAGLPTWTYVSFNFPESKLSGTVDFKKILDHLVTTGVVSPDHYVAGVELGSEVQKGSGQLSIHKLDVKQTTNQAGKDDCVFNWASANYPELFYRWWGSPSETLGEYYYRRFHTTWKGDAYLGVSNTSRHLYFRDYSGQMLDLGPMTNWHSAASCS